MGCIKEEPTACFKDIIPVTGGEAGWDEDKPGWEHPKVCGENG